MPLHVADCENESVEKRIRRTNGKRESVLAQDRILVSLECCSAAVGGLILHSQHGAATYRQRRDGAPQFARQNSFVSSVYRVSRRDLISFLDQLQPAETLGCVEAFAHRRLPGEPVGTLGR